jgi:hypothetical protein
MDLKQFKLEMDTFISTRLKFCDITIAEAEKLSSQHENDSQWDLWDLKKEFINDPEREDRNQVAG